MRLSRLEGAANRRVGTESDKDAHFGVCRGKNARLATEQRVRSVNEQGRVAWTRPLKLRDGTLNEDLDKAGCAFGF